VTRRPFYAAAKRQQIVLHQKFEPFNRVRDRKQHPNRVMMFMRFAAFYF
jgi:hypothetical protein